LCNITDALSHVSILELPRGMGVVTPSRTKEVPFHWPGANQ